MANYVRHLLICIAVTLAGMGCATPPPAPVPAEIIDLKKQIFELQKTQGVQAGQIEELSNKILLLNDKIGLRSGVSPGSGVTPQAPAPSSKGTPTSAAPNPGLPPMSNAVVAAVAVNKRTVPVVGAERIYNQALVDAKKPQMIALEKDVQALLASYKESPVTNNGLFLLADTYYARKQYSKAAEQFERLYKLFPDGNKAVGSLYRLGLCYQKMGHPAEAKEAFENVVTIYPGSREALQAEKLLQNDAGAVQ